MTGETARDVAADDTRLGWLGTRRSVGAARLADPGPDAGELRRILAVAARVPDHGALVPWRFIIVEKDARGALADTLSAACLAASEGSGEANAQAQRTAQKLRLLFGQPPVIVVVVSRSDVAAKIPLQEQTLSAGAACMNLITAATALGFGTNWLTGWAAAHPAARPIFGLQKGESIAGIIPIGTPMEPAAERPRPDLSTVVTVWQP